MIEPYLKAVELMNDFKDWKKEDARKYALTIVRTFIKSDIDKEYYEKVQHHLLYL